MILVSSPTVTPIVDTFSFVLLSTLKILKSPAANAASADPLAKLPYIGTITFLEAIKFEKSLQ